MCVGTVVLILFGALLHPDALLMIPLRLASLCGMYVTFVIQRVVQRIELEASVAFFGGTGYAYPAPADPSTSMAPAPVPAPPNLQVHHAASPFHMLGWLLALVCWVRK